jgi:dihydropyrimidinase
VGVKDGRVVALGEGLGAARETLDAHGLVVAPGFVDIQHNQPKPHIFP